MTEHNENELTEEPLTGCYLTSQQAEKINDLIWNLGMQVFEIFSDSEFISKKI